MDIQIDVTYTKSKTVSVPDIDLGDKQSEEYEGLMRQLCDAADQMKDDETISLEWCCTSFLHGDEEFDDVG